MVVEVRLELGDMYITSVIDVEILRAEKMHTNFKKADLFFPHVQNENRSTLIDRNKKNIFDVSRI